MALVKCKECGTEVSSKAEACPKCGVRIARKPIGCGTAIGVIFLIGIISSVILSPDKKEDTTIEPIPSSSNNTETIPPPQAKLPGSQWFYYQSDDEMSKGTICQATVSSSNTVNFGFPYSGEQRATLTLRTHPRYGKDLIFSIEKGQFLCPTYEDCTVLVRFDDEQATNFNAVGAADNSTETIFIRNYSRFVEKMLGAKRVRISANIYQEGAPVFEFDVSSFDQKRYKPNK